MSEEPRKRSRFDQTEPKRVSRFDRRSRSPSSRTAAERSRSPLKSKSPRNDALDPAAAAAAAAARINAQLQARKAELPPAQPVVVAPRKNTEAAEITDEIYTQDGDYIKDIEINDLRNRYTLTKGSTQKMIKDETGADVTTRGEYFPDKSMSTPTNPPLYLHITSTTKEGLEQAIDKINEMMQQELPNLVDERRFKRREPEQFERDEYGRRKWPEEKIPIDLEPIPGFNLRAQVVGAGGAYVKHIQGETRCRVQIKGRGSGFKDQHTGLEHDEPMYLHVAGPDPEMVKTAKELCVDLLENVKQEYERFKERGPQHRGNYGDRSGGGYGDRGNRQDNHNNNNYGGHSHGGYQNNNYHNGYGSSQHSNDNQGAGAQGGSQEDLMAQYAQYYASQPGGDPYAQYGGYQAYMQMYYQYYQQQQQPSGDASTPTPGAPPPPPPSNDQPPPPPPPPSNDQPPPPPPPPSAGPPGAGTYNAVPPPPGL